MPEIELTRGLKAIVDEDDLERVSVFNWHAACGGKYAATRPKHNGPVIMLHRFILGATSEDVDHINGNGLDCRKSNLRACTHQQNMLNMKKRVGGSSRFIGVGWHRAAKKWAARTRVDGVQTHIGLFDCEETAARARDLVAACSGGGFARLNFSSGV